MAGNAEGERVGVRKEVGSGNADGGKKGRREKKSLAHSPKLATRTA